MKLEIYHKSIFSFRRGGFHPRGMMRGGPPMRGGPMGPPRGMPFNMQRGRGMGGGPNRGGMNRGGMGPNRGGGGMNFQQRGGGFRGGQRGGQPQKYGGGPAPWSGNQPNPWQQPQRPQQGIFLTYYIYFNLQISRSL